MKAIAYWVITLRKAYDGEDLSGGWRGHRQMFKSYVDHASAIHWSEYHKENGWELVAMKKVTCKEEADALSSQEIAAILMVKRTGKPRGRPGSPIIRLYHLD